MKHALKLFYKSNRPHFLWVGYHAGKPIESVAYCLSNHRAVIITLKARSFQNGSQIF